MKIGFALITSTPFFDNVIKLEHSFHTIGNFSDYLGTKTNLPHTTIFQGDMDEKINYIEIADKIAEKFLELNSDKTLEFTKIDYIPKGWYFFLCVNTCELQKLHDYTLDLVKPYIILDPKRLERNLDDLTDEQYKAIVDYGYRYASAAFYPHITIGRSKSKNDEVLKNMNSSADSFEKTAKVSKITVYRMGNNGTHAETLYERLV